MLYTVPHARIRTTCAASLSLFSWTTFRAFARARARAGGREGLDRAGAGIDSSSTLWIRYCALRSRSSVSTLSTFAYANTGVVFSSSIFSFVAVGRGGGRGAEEARWWGPKADTTARREADVAPRRQGGEEGAAPRLR